MSFIVVVLTGSKSCSKQRHTQKILTLSLVVKWCNSQELFLQESSFLVFKFLSLEIARCQWKLKVSISNKIAKMFSVSNINHGTSPYHYFLLTSLLNLIAASVKFFLSTSKLPFCSLSLPFSLRTRSFSSHRSDSCRIAVSVATSCESRLSWQTGFKIDTSGYV